MSITLLSNKLKYIKTAIATTPNVNLDLLNNVKALETKIKKTELALWGDGEMAKHQYETYPGLDNRIGNVIYDIFESSNSSSCRF